jgi:hypothetical protein
VVQSALGVSPECFSAEDLVQAFYEGVTNKHATHLKACKTCAENVSAFVATMAGEQKDVVSAALRGVQPEGEKAPRFIPDVVPAIIAMKSNRINVLRKPAAVTFVCDVIPLGLEGLLSIDASSCKATGALVSTDAPRAELVDSNNDGQPDFVRLSFSGLGLGKSIASAIHKNQSVVDTVQITGTLSGGSHTSRFAGQMQVELQQSPAAPSWAGSADSERSA